MMNRQLEVRGQRSEVRGQRTASIFSLQSAVFAAVLAVGVLAGTALATEYTWDGSTSGDWGTADNWDVAPTFGNTAELIFYSAAVNINPCFLGTDKTIKSLKFNASADSAVNIRVDTGSPTARNLYFDADAGSATITVEAGATGNHTLGSTSRGSIYLFDNLVVEHNGSGTLTLGRAVLGNPAVSVTKTGSGVLILNAGHTWTGLTQVDGGELRWGDDNGLAGGNLTVNNTATVNMLGRNDTVGTVTLNAGGTIKGTTGRLTTGSGGFVSTGGNISDFSSGGVSLGGNLTYNTSGGAETTLTINGVLGATARTFTIANGVNAVDVDIQGTISGVTSLTKAGLGTMRIGGSVANNLSTATTVINDGVLILNNASGGTVIGSGAVTIGDGSGSAESAVLRYADYTDQIQSSVVTINSDGLWDLNGKTETVGGLTITDWFAIGAVTVNGSTLSGAVAGAVGTLNLAAGDITFNSGSTFVVDFASATSYDTIVRTGASTVNYLNNAVLQVNSSAFQPSSGQTFTIIANNDAMIVNNGTFSGLAEGAAVNVGGVICTISYVGGDGNDIVLTATDTVLITPTDVGSAMPDDTADRKKIYTINNSGVGNPQSAGYATHRRDASGGVQWLSKSTVTGSITYDLGAVYNLTHLVIWNYSENFNEDRGIKDFTIQYYDKDNNLLHTSGTLTAAMAPTSGTRIPAEVIDIPDVSNVNKIKVVIATNYGDTAGSGISELKFQGTYVAAHVNYTTLDLVQPTAAATTMSWPDLERGPEHSWNGNGFTSGYPPLRSTSGHGGADDDYMLFEFTAATMGGTKGTVTYTLPDVLEVSALALWNGHWTANNSIRNFEIRLLNESDAVIATVGSLVARKGDQYGYDLGYVAGNGKLHCSLSQRAGHYPELFSFTPVAGVKKVQLYITTNHGGGSGAISEVGVYGSVALPSGTLILLR